jgi:hypothetical protein
VIITSAIVTGSAGIGAVLAAGLYLLLRTGETIVPGGRVIEHHGAGSNQQQHENRILLRAHAIDIATIPQASTVAERWPEEDVLGRQWRAGFNAHIDDINRRFDALVASLAAPLTDRRSSDPDFMEGDRALVDTLAQTSPADVLAWARSDRPVTSLYRTGAYPIVSAGPITPRELVTL